MKNNIFSPKLLTIIVLGFFTLLTFQVGAQENWKKAVYQSDNFSEKGHSFQSNVRLNEINTQAFRHFRKSFPAIESEYWEKNQNGFMARFKESNKFTMVYYDNQGSFQYSVKYFEESDLDEEIQKRIKKEYPGFQLDIVTEINNEIRNVYLVTLKNKYSMKSLLINQGEIQVIDDLNYAGL